MFILSSLGVYKASEARLLLLMYQVNFVNQGNQLKDSATSPAKIIDDSWTMDGFVSFSGHNPEQPQIHLESLKQKVYEQTRLVWTFHFFKIVINLLEPC